MTQGRPTSAGSDTPDPIFFALLACTATTAALGGDVANRNIPPEMAAARE
ncbi:hypothetical protein [Rhizobium leguminosarum]|nr:hypothetical protein [Rhizobium leguminosarum]MBY5590089.1 hypothetical protein [Rhizobium leguminosarum]MBY5601625.1 hypothetical protein [Rhizobium leguminosarum]MBY5698793.1 hypothetical protein [Rhizobium leguminosarum]